MNLFRKLSEEINFIIPSFCKERVIKKNSWIQILSKNCAQKKYIVYILFYFCFTVFI